MSNKNNTPTIGEGATVIFWSDRYPCTVIKVTANTVTMREDKATRTDSNGMSECQEYTYEEDPNGKIYKATRRKLKDGSCFWKLVGYKIRDRGGNVYFGKRCRYYDYSL